MSRQRTDTLVSGSTGWLAAPAPTWWHLPALIALALVVRWAAWSNAVLMFNDGPDFLWQARMMLEGRWLESLHHQYHPLYAVTVAGLAWLAFPYECSLVFARSSDMTVKAVVGNIQLSAFEPFNTHCVAPVIIQNLVPFFVEINILFCHFAPETLWIFD